MLGVIVMVEIRAAEGGADARDLVREQAGIYAAYCKRIGLDCEIVDERTGALVLEIAGDGALAAFWPESGGHRWQRVPPTERRGRRHTSTVTVAVLPVERNVIDRISPADIQWSATRGSGAGGQARNKTSNAVLMRHAPTGISVRVESSRSQFQNRETALRMLAGRIYESRERAKWNAENSTRKRLVGSGQRGDKIRTVRLQDDRVVDHRTGRTMKASRYRQGFVGELTERQNG